jgi:hypothetical protein
VSDTQIISEESLAQLRRLMELREARDTAKVDLTAKEKAFRDAEADAYESLSVLAGSLKINLGDPWGTVQFSPRETHFGRVYDKEAARRYFEDQMMTAAIAEPTFVRKRLNEIVRDCREQGIKPPPGVDWTTNRGVTITRQKGG